MPTMKPYNTNKYCAVKNFDEFGELQSIRQTVVTMKHVIMPFTYWNLRMKQGI